MTRMLRSTLTAMLVLTAAGTPAMAGEQRQDHDRARRGVMNGALTLRQIEGRILPQMGDADYLGPEFDGDAYVYRLKFLRAGRVFWVDVDARTGDVIGRSGR